MTIRELTSEEIRDIYNTYMTDDFPPDELKPLDRIEEAISVGKYYCLGAFENMQLVAYAFWVFNEKNYLLDYYAVVPDFRGKGVGTVFLKEAVKLIPADIILLEVEDPTDEEKKKRLDFYLNAGCVDPNVKAVAFGVDFMIIEYPIKGNHSPSVIADAYKEIYRSILPQKMYEDNISIVNE